jgi:hypothetical protein
MCSNATFTFYVYVLSCFKYLPAYLSFLSLSIINVSVVSYIHTTLNTKYRYVGTYLPTYLPTYLLGRRFLTYIPPCWACLAALKPNFAQTRPFLRQNPQVAERHTLAEPAFSMAEPAGGVCPSVDVLKPRSQLIS